MQKKERFTDLVRYFSANYPEAETELVYTNPFELLVAVILSAQCTDKRVNIITQKLFLRFPTPESLSVSNVEEIFDYIKSVSYPNNKAKHLLGMARILVNDFNSEVPSTIEDLQKMPGVGRKTANVIVSVIFNKPAMAVDTHVFRVSHRLGLVSQTAKSPLLVEKQLTKHIPKDKIALAHHWLILHGRYVCVARTPKCGDCNLKPFCKAFERQKFDTPRL
jgi:endonuclease-3